MKTLNRRTVLRGAGGIALGLPFLEAMAVGSLSSNPIRLAYLYMPNGVGPDSAWNPKKVGKDFDLGSAVKTLEPVKHLVNIHTGLDQTPIGTHMTTTAGLLSAKRPKKPSVAEAYITIDQIAANQIGQDSYLSSLELSIDAATTNVTSAGLNTTHGSYISWSSPTTPVPREVDPNSAFRRLFKDKSRGSALSGTDISKSVLDYIKDDANSLKRVLGREDNRKIDEYFYSIRQIERRLNKMSKSKELPAGAKAPAKDIPDVREKIKAMTEIMVLAFQTDRTKVASLMFANDSSQKRYTFLPGVNLNHHAISHYKGKKGYVEMQIEITKFFVGCYASMIKRMSEIREGNGTLLDNSLVLFTSNMKEGYNHTPKDMPAIVAGRGGGSVDTGYHHKHNDKAFASLLMGMAKTAGCKNLKGFAKTNEYII